MIIAVDFDGTCVTHAFPELGKDIGAAPVLRMLVESGHKLILWTMRSDQVECDFSASPELHPESAPYLEQAILWFKRNNIPLWGINQNPDQASWTSSPKVYAHLYIDDAALGIPLRNDHEDTTCHRLFVDWEKVYSMLRERDIITFSKDDPTFGCITISKEVAIERYGIPKDLLETAIKNQWVRVVGDGLDEHIVAHWWQRRKEYKARVAARVKYKPEPSEPRQRGRKPATCPPGSIPYGVAAHMLGIASSSLAAYACAGRLQRSAAGYVTEDSVRKYAADRDIIIREYPCKTELIGGDWAGAGSSCASPPPQQPSQDPTTSCAEPASAETATTT